jgi:hypothetical protein
MITHHALAPLRLKDFLPHPDRIEAVDGWEFMDKVWLGEVYGLTEWLRLREDPQVLRSVSLDLADLDQDVADRILETLQLLLEFGMEPEEINQVLESRPGRCSSCPTGSRTNTWRGTGIHIIFLQRSTNSTAWCTWW